MAGDVSRSLQVCVSGKIALFLQQFPINMSGLKWHHSTATSFIISTFKAHTSKDRGNAASGPARPLSVAASQYREQQAEECLQGAPTSLLLQIFIRKPIIRQPRIAFVLWYYRTLKTHSCHFHGNITFVEHVHYICMQITWKEHLPSMEIGSAVNDGRCLRAQLYMYSDTSISVSSPAHSIHGLEVA